MTNVQVFDELHRVICERAREKSGKKSRVRYHLLHEKYIYKLLEKMGERLCKFVFMGNNRRKKTAV
jgi:hypothetical protein